MDICISITDSLCCTAETKTMLKINDAPIKNIFLSLKNKKLVVLYENYESLLWWGQGRHKRTQGKLTDWAVIENG